MKPFAFLSLWLASCCLCFGAGSLNGVAVTAWNGVAISAWNGTSISAAGGGGGGGPIAFATGAANLWSTSNVSSYASNSYTPTSNALLLCGVANSRGSATAATPTLTGNGLTWVQVNTVTCDSGLKRLTIFRALGASPTTGAVTADFAGDNQTGCHIVVVQFTGVDTSGTNGSGAVVQSNTGSGAGTSVSVTLSALTGSSNAVWMIGCNRGATGFQGTPEASWTENTDATGGSPNFGFSDIYRLATTDNTPSTTITSDNWGAVAVEIKVSP